MYKGTNNNNKNTFSLSPQNLVVFVIQKLDGLSNYESGLRNLMTASGPAHRP